jgi:hypothetical protein
LFDQAHDLLCSRYRGISSHVNISYFCLCCDRFGWVEQQLNSRLLHFS